MSAEIRTPSEDDREAIARVLSTSLNFPLDRALERKHTFPLEQIRCAYVDGAVVATAAEHLFHQRFGGAALDSSGIWGVATLPEYRGTGLASACTGEVMDEAHRRGDPVTALFPAVVEPYRRLGYELAGTYDTHHVSLDALPTTEPDDRARIQSLDVDRDLEDIRSCYERWIRPYTGAIEPTPDLWRDRILTRTNDDTFRSIVVREDGVLTGFTSFGRQPAEGHLPMAFGVDCTSFVSTTPASLHALLSYMRGHRGIGRWMQWTGPPNDPITLLVGVQAVETTDRYRWMLRIIDVRAAFAQRGYPAIDAEATIAVDDPRYPENAGPWRVELSGGKASVSEAGDHDRRPIPIGALSSMFSGYLSPHDAVRLGHLDADDPAVEGLAAMFAGPDPWCPFFF